MYAITGITGQVGGAVARHLLAGEEAVRAVVQDGRKGEAWQRRGCQVAIAEMTDADALSSAIVGVQGLFILIPPMFDPAPGLPEIRQVIAALVEAVGRTRVPKLVCLSTIGAQSREPNLLSQLGLVEEALAALPMPVKAAMSDQIPSDRKRSCQVRTVCQGPNSRGRKRQGSRPLPNTSRR